MIDFITIVCKLILTIVYRTIINIASLSRYHLSSPSKQTRGPIVVNKARKVGSG